MAAVRPRFQGLTEANTSTTVPVGSRFRDLTEEELQNILDARDSKNTKSLVKASLSILSGYLSSRGAGSTLEILETKPIHEISEILRKFYAEMTKADGSRYAKKSMVSIRYGLQKHFLKTIEKDIINDKDFSKSIEMFKAVLVQLKKDGIGESKQKEPIIPEDMNKLYDNVFSTDNPTGLQQKTVFEYLYYFCNRGRENLRELQKEDFTLKMDSTGREYVSINKQRQTKNHRGDDIQDTDSKQGRMYGKPGDPRCPVASFKKYLGKLHPDNPNFWQRPKKNFNKMDDKWFENAPVGKNILYSFIARLSEEAHLSKRYTNHCVRATSITTLDHKGIEARHIMGISGHKSETSIKCYSANLSDTKKRQISDILCENVAPKVMKKSCCTAACTSMENSATSMEVPVLPDLLLNDNLEVDKILSEIASYEMCNANDGNVPTKTVAASPVSSFNISNCQITFNFGK